MRLKVVCLNIWRGRRLSKTIEFLQGEAADLVLLQEVVDGGKIYDKRFRLGVYQTLEGLLGLNSEFAPMWEVRTKELVTKIGVAVFSRFKIISYRADFYYKQLIEVEGEPRGGENFPGLALNVEVEAGEGSLRFITTHFVWSEHPKISSLQLEAAKNLGNYLGRFDSFVFAGDMNSTDDSQVYKIVSEGLVDDRPVGLENTLHPRIHVLKGSKKLAVDYVFHKGDRFRLVESRVPVVDASDHLPVVAVYDVF